MEEIINIQDLMSRLVKDGITPEDLVACAIRNFYSAESSLVAKNKICLRNNIRATVAYVKLLYDYGQQMCLARLYLLHRIKLLEVRDHDHNLEISLLRGLSPPLEKFAPNSDETNIKHWNSSCSNYQDKVSDQELEIILDTRMIKEIDLPKAALHDISNRIEDKKNALFELEQKIEDAFSIFLSSIEQGTSTLESEHYISGSSSRVERTPCITQSL